MHTTVLLAVLVTGAAPATVTANAPQQTAVTLNSFVISLIDDVRVPARESGVLVSLDAKENQVVKKGDLLGQINDADAQVRLIIAQNELKVAAAQAESDADVKAAEATVGVAKAEYDGTREIRGRAPDAVSVFEERRLKLTHERSLYQSINANVEHRVAQFTKEMKTAQLQAVENEIARRTVVSPIDGVVIQRFLDPGEWAQVGDPVYRVVRMDRLRVEGMLPALADDGEEVTAEDATRALMPDDVQGQPVTIQVKTPRGVEKIQAKIDFASPVVDSSGEFLVFAEFDNPRKPNGQWLIRPGLEATVTILLKSPDSARKSQ